MDWFNAIRSVQFHYLKVAFPIASDNEVRQHGSTVLSLPLVLGYAIKEPISYD